MRTIIAIIAAATAACARADTWTLTNGVEVTGSVVSSQVATVWIKTDAGKIDAFPAASFDRTSGARLPSGISEIYKDYLRQYALTEHVLETAQMAVDKYKALEARTNRSMANVGIDLDATQKRLAIIYAELDGWREANDLRDATPAQRRAFVDAKVSKESEKLLDK